MSYSSKKSKTKSPITDTTAVYNILYRAAKIHESYTVHTLLSILYTVYGHSSSFGLSRWT